MFITFNLVPFKFLVQTFFFAHIRKKRRNKNWSLPPKEKPERKSQTNIFVTIIKRSINVMR